MRAFRVLEAAWRRVPKGITFRISLLSWLITVVTLAVFVTAVIPLQKTNLENVLASKARGIASSLQDVTAGAAVSADYSSVVEQCLQVLAGDEAIEYVVVTKNDGFSIVVDRQGWRTETLGSFWRPADRQASGRIATVPLFGRRVFHASKPFDYSGIPWGWINVGLSLRDYDRSAVRIYVRTSLLAVLCCAFSLLASVRYASRLVRPMRGLQTVVGRVAAGDLSARAHIRTGDEVESLAASFNGMADSILQRNHILESVRFAAQEFLTAEDWRKAMPGVLERIGTSAHAAAACFSIRASEAEDRGRSLYEWPAGARNDADRDWTAGLPAGACDSLRAGEIVCHASDANSSILVPVQLEGGFFGFLGFEDPRPGREWSAAERDCFRAVAGMLGAAIARQRAQEALIEAKETLEQRVLERTSELQEQAIAKERAHAALAEAQQRLIELSRRSGMAEIATGVLHNVGNVLNSVNVSATLVADKVRESRIGNLISLIALLQEHSEDLTEFLRTDPKGARVLPYLARLGTYLQEEREVMVNELRLLTDHIGHIKQIVATQQNYAKVSGLIEDISLPALLEDAIRMLEPGMDKARVALVREFQTVPPIAADKHLILQIVLNLLRNAKQAVLDSGNDPKIIGVSVWREGEERVRVRVVDNGVGLPAENLTRIFAHGFTTKPDGHGFGLHSGAVAARQMGGSLWAESEGPGRGATFVLELPLKAAPAVQKV